MSNFPGDLSDAELVNLVDQMTSKLMAAPEIYGATAAQANDLKTKTDGFSADLTAHLEAQTTARSKTQAKDASRDTVEAAIRFLVKQARLNGVSDTVLAGLGVPVGGDAGLETSATRPVASVDTSQRFMHTVKFTDEAAPDIKRLPRGVLGCEIYQKIGGAPPADFKECVFLGLDTKTPYAWEFDAGDVGKMVHYMLRWRHRDESVSAWSETVSATVTG